MRKTALLICDMLNPFDFPEAPMILPSARRAALAIKKLKTAAKAKKIPIIYANDNFDHWFSDWKNIYATVTKPDCPGKKIAELLEPDEDDYFILKPKHSAFYSTSLDILLKHLKVKRLIITGIAGNICVLFSAHDAHMREYEVLVPRDCCASNSTKDNLFVLNQLSKNFSMNTANSKSWVKKIN